MEPVKIILNDLNYLDDLFCNKKALLNFYISLSLPFSQYSPK